MFSNTKVFKRWQRPTCQKLQVVLRWFSNLSVSKVVSSCLYLATMIYGMAKDGTGTIHNLSSISSLSITIAGSSFANVQNVSTVTCIRPVHFRALSLLDQFSIHQPAIVVADYLVFANCPRRRQTRPSIRRRNWWTLHRDSRSWRFRRQSRFLIHTVQHPSQFSDLWKREISRRLSKNRCILVHISKEIHYMHRKRLHKNQYKRQRSAIYASFQRERWHLLHKTFVCSNRYLTSSYA